MNFRVQRFDAAVHDLGEARVARHFCDGYAVAGEKLCGAAGREDLDGAVRECLRKFDESRLVGDGQQRAADRNVHLVSKAELPELLA